MILEAKERELIEKQRQINLLLDDSDEKQKLLLEALRLQGKQYLQTTVPTYVPTTTTTSTTSSTTTPFTTTSTTTTPTTTLATTQFIEIETPPEDLTEDEEFQVEIFLEMTRELVESKHKDKENLTTDHGHEDFKSVKQQDTEINSSPFNAIMNAKEAVRRTMETGAER